MDARVVKLKIKFGSSTEEAEALVAAGFDTPAKIRAGNKTQINSAIGKDRADVICERLGR